MDILILRGYIASDAELSIWLQGFEKVLEEFNIAIRGLDKELRLVLIMGAGLKAFDCL